MIGSVGDLPQSAPSCCQPGSRMLVMMPGVPGAGKSHFASRLAQ